MTKLRCLIADDEPLAIKILENYVAQINFLECVAACRNGVEAFNILQSEKIDLVFLDIQMPQLTGINLLKNLTNPPCVIFTTAHREFAIESYELNALDYLLKPISFERFLKAVQKVEAISQSDSKNQSIATHQPNFDEAFIYLKADKKVFKVMLKQIILIESLKDYIIVHTTDSKIITYINISHIEPQLPPDKFLRIHRSFIIGLDYLRSFSATDIVLSNQQEYPIGRTYKDVVAKVLMR